MARIFVSYKRVDKEKVFEIVNLIETTLDEKCWIDNEGIESASQFKNVIIRAINDCEIMLFMYSKTHLEIDYEKDWTMRELNFAMRKNKRIVFINIDRSPLTDAFEFDFGTQQQIDGTSKQSLSRLLKDLGKWLGITKPTSSLPQPTQSSRQQNKKSDITTFSINGVSFDMVHVEGGKFMMGATKEQGSVVYDAEKPTHLVTLSDYQIGKHEVTQALWKAVMEKNPSYSKGDEKPVEQVSWDDCQTFITKLNSILSSQLGGKHFALPTEAQWEYAARGGQKSQGYKYAGSDTPEEVAWFCDNSEHDSHAVGTRLPNELGLYDMSGNVWEWCQDWFNSYDQSSQTDPQGPSEGLARVRRGGAWSYNVGGCRVSYRSSFSPSSRYYFLGFRLVLIS